MAQEDVMSKPRKARCSFCGTQKFGLVRRVGYYLTGLYISRREFCTAGHKLAHEVAHAQRERQQKFARWLHS
jgi:hypothetical protein